MASAILKPPLRATRDDYINRCSPRKPPHIVTLWNLCLSACAQRAERCLPPSVCCLWCWCWWPRPARLTPRRKSRCVGDSWSAMPCWRAVTLGWGEAWWTRSLNSCSSTSSLPVSHILQVTVSNITHRLFRCLFIVFVHSLCELAKLVYHTHVVLSEPPLSTSSPQGTRNPPETSPKLKSRPPTLQSLRRRRTRDFPWPLTGIPWSPGSDGPPWKYLLIFAARKAAAWRTWYSSARKREIEPGLQF